MKTAQTLVLHAGAKNKNPTKNVNEKEIAAWGFIIVMHCKVSIFIVEIFETIEFFFFNYLIDPLVTISAFEEKKKKNTAPLLLLTFHN